MVERTRRPALNEIGDPDLDQPISRLRERRDGARDLFARRRGGAGIDRKESTGLREKSRLLAEAVSRENKERSRRRKATEKTELRTNARRAPKLRKAAPALERPSAGRTKNRG